MNKKLFNAITNHLAQREISYTAAGDYIFIADEPLVYTQTIPLDQRFWHVDEHDFVLVPDGLGLERLQTVGLATGNQGKLGEYQRMIQEIAWQTIDQSPVLAKSVLDAVDEYLPTFTGNALLKSMHVARAASADGQWVLADDSGFCLAEVSWGDMPCEVPGAGGVFPGVYTKRFAKAIHPQGLIDYAFACQWLSKHISALSPAYFECAIALSKSGELTESWVSNGRVHGQFINPSVQGENGFGFDPVFRPNGSTQTFSEMTQDQKNAISHRALALTKFKREFLDAV